jgi:Ca-activated chloride channel family protein
VNAASHLLRPEAWPVLVLVPLTAFVLSRLGRLRARRLADVVGPRATALADGPDPHRRGVRVAIATAALLFASIAVLEPTWGEDGGAEDGGGPDVVVCLDVSRSMLARDAEPNRLERARREIRAFSERARGGRLALVVFAGEARLVAPLTRDGESFRTLLDLCDPASVRRGGTDLGAALDAALGALAGETGGNGVIVLVTDGEDIGGNGRRVARTCKDRNVAVHCVGLGSARGAKIAVPGDRGESFVRDRAGNEVISAMDPSSLRAIASTTGGEFVDAGASASPVAELYEQRIRPMAGRVCDPDGRRERANRFQWALLPAVLLWMLDLVLTDRVRR